MKDKKKIAVFFGGCSTEYEVSLQSAAAVIAHIDTEKYETVFIGLDGKTGEWLWYRGTPELIEKDRWRREGACVPVYPAMDRSVSGFVYWEAQGMKTISVDAALPILHGKNGEDSIRENGPAFTKKFVALPGHSEHETGLAIDLAKRQPGIDFICPEFPRDGSFGVFRDKLPRYGFIERYLEGKENITGIGAEPWHFRYVGFPHSAIIAERGMVLEEYIEFLKEGASLRKPYRYGGIAVFYVPLCGETEKTVCLPFPAPTREAL